MKTALIVLFAASAALAQSTDPTKLPSYPEFISLAKHVQQQRKEFNPIVKPFQDDVDAKNKEAQGHVDEIEAKIKALQTEEEPYLKAISANGELAGKDLTQKLKEEDKLKEWTEFQSNVTALNNRWAVIREDAGLGPDVGFNVDTLSIVYPKVAKK